MTSAEKKAIYAALAAPFPEHCIQRTEGRLTGRGYDTVGYGYQHVANRLNEVLGVGGWRAHRMETITANRGSSIITSAGCAQAQKPSQSPSAQLGGGRGIAPAAGENQRFLAIASSEDQARIETMTVEADYVERRGLDPYEYIAELKRRPDGIALLEAA